MVVRSPSISAVCDNANSIGRLSFSRVREVRITENSGTSGFPKLGTYALRRCVSVYGGCGYRPVVRVGSPHGSGVRSFCGILLGGSLLGSTIVVSFVLSSLGRLRSVSPALGV